MSHYLDAVREAREERDARGSELVERIRAAREAGHTLREIGEAASMSAAGVKWHLDRQENAR
jgi:hypothetical protein